MICFRTHNRKMLLIYQKTVSECVWESFFKIHVVCVRYNRVYVCVHQPTIWSQWLIIYEKLKSLKLSQRLGSCCRLFRVKIIKQNSVVEFEISEQNKTFFTFHQARKAEVMRNFWDNLTTKMSVGLKENWSILLSEVNWEWMLARIFIQMTKEKLPLSCQFKSFLAYF